MATLNNKWTHGKVTFVLPPLPAEFQGAEGIIPWNFVLDPSVGTETILLLLDRTPFIHDLAKIRPIDLHLKTGLVRTGSGPLMFLLFSFPDPRGPGPVFSAIEAHANPLDVQHMQMWRDLARQSHWHLILVGANDELVNLFEFENVFGLEQAIEQVEATCRGMVGGSFDEAKAEFCATYTIDDLFGME